MDAPTDTAQRKCKYCGRRYTVKKWSKPEGCSECAPTIVDAIRPTAGQLHERAQQSEPLRASA